jgi:hypothetical protein
VAYRDIFSGDGRGGAARNYGSINGYTLNAPIVGSAADPATGRYWLVGGDEEHEFGVRSLEIPVVQPLGVLITASGGLATGGPFPRATDKES